MLETTIGGLRAIHRPLNSALRAVLRSARYHSVERVWTRTPDEKSYLGLPELQHLQAEYPIRRPYRYDPDSLAQRAKWRIDQLIELPGARGASTFLEVGCGDGMVTAELQSRGKAATGVDRRETGMDPRASATGARLLQMDAEELGLADSSCDFAFSYDSFEHIAAPDRAFREMTRVVRPGGYIYLDFGPLYHSPWGEHAYRTITAPYCQFLFPRQLMNDYAETVGLKPIDWNHVNGWSIEQYRALWRELTPALEVVSYHEVRDQSHLHMIRKYPSCFKGTSISFENFVVAHIRALFRKD